MNRINFLILTTCGFLSVKNKIYATQNYQKETKFFAAFNKGKKSYFGCFDITGNVFYNVKLENRVHDYIILPELKHIFIVARRPDNFIYVIDIDSGSIIHKITSPMERHFYGHAIYNEHSKLIYVTENHYKYSHYLDNQHK